MNNFLALPGESVSSSWDRLTLYVRSVPNHRIYDESLKEYFYRGKDDNNKAVLDTIAGSSYGECTYAEIAENLEKISRNSKSWSIRKSGTGRNTFAVKATHNLALDEIREEIAQIRIEIGLVLKRITGGAEKVNKVNYLTKPPPPADKFYYEEDSYTVNDQTSDFQINSQGSNQENWCQDQGNLGQSYGNHY